MEGFLRKTFEPLSDGLDYVCFVLTLLQPVEDLWDQLQRSCDPLGVNLYVHLMMDMRRAYEVDADGKPLLSRPAPPALRYDGMIREMAELQWQVGGRLLGFVAFEPRRPGALELVKKALAMGFVGVKLYPPMGYFPYDAAYRRVFDDLYEYCQSEGIPVLTHCSPTGFEAWPGHGNYCDPDTGYASPAHDAGWSAVLARYPRLRLCFAHAGSGGQEAHPKIGSSPGAKIPFQGWYDQHLPWGTPADDPHCYAARIVEHCCTYENAYCDFAHYHGISFPGASRDQLKTNLTAALKLRGNYKLSEKVMYGSDWHMPEAIPLVDEMYDAFRELFDDPALSAAAPGFFGCNALRWLNLAGAAARIRRANPTLSPKTEATLRFWESL